MNASTSIAIEKARAHHHHPHRELPEPKPNSFGSACQEARQKRCNETPPISRDVQVTATQIERRIDCTATHAC
jgi:hypothetical protein